MDDSPVSVVLVSTGHGSGPTSDQHRPSSQPQYGSAPHSDSEKPLPSQCTSHPLVPGYPSSNSSARVPSAWMTTALVSTVVSDATQRTRSLGSATGSSMSSRSPPVPKYALPSYVPEEYV